MRRRRSRSRRELFIALIHAVRVPSTPSPIRNNTAPCRGCLPPAHYPSVTRVAAAPVTSSAITTRAVWGGGGDAHKSEQINRITVYKSVLFDSNIYILCMVAAWQAAATAAMGKGMKLTTRRIRSAEVLILPSVVLGANIKTCECKELQRGGGRAPMNNLYPALLSLSLCVIPPLLCITRWYSRTYGCVYWQQEAKQRPLDWTLVKEVDVFFRSAFRRPVSS